MVTRIEPILLQDNARPYTKHLVKIDAVRYQGFVAPQLFIFCQLSLFRVLDVHICGSRCTPVGTKLKILYHALSMPNDPSFYHDEINLLPDFLGKILC